MSDTGPSRILIVDDDRLICGIVQAAFAAQGRTVEAFSSGSEALERAADFAPDLILLDVVMEGMDGPSTLVALRRLPACRTVPVVFLTGSTAPEDRSGLLTLGAVGVIAKPFDPTRLVSMIDDLWIEARAA